MDDNNNPINIKRVSRRRVDIEALDGVPAPITEISETEEELDIEIGSIRSFRWEKIGRFCMFLLAGLTPIFFLPITVLPVEINKQFLGALLVIVAIICYLADGLTRKKIIYPKSFLALSVVILMAVVFISSLLSISKAVSIPGSFVRPDTFLSFMMYALAFLSAFRFFESKEDWQKAIYWFLSGLGALTLVSLLQSYQNFWLPWGFTKNSSWNASGSIFAWSLLMGAGISYIASLNLKSEERSKRFFYYGLGIFFAISLFILNYQFIWGALTLISILIVLIKYFTRRDFILPLIVAVISISLSLVGKYIPPLSNVPLEVWPSYSTSFNIAKEAIKGGDILLGSGPATFGYEYSLARPQAVNFTNFWNIRFNQGYDFFVTSLSNLGILGVAAILFLIFSFVRIVLKNRESEDVIALSSIVGFLMIGWVIYPAFFSGMIIVFLALGMISRFSGEADEVNLEREGGAKPFALFVAAIIVLSLSVTSLFVIGQKYASAFSYGSGLNAITAGNLEKAIARLDSARTLDRNSDESLRVLSQALILRARNTLNGQSPLDISGDKQIQFQNDVASAVTIAKQATDVNPADSLNWENLGSIYESLIGLAANSQNFAVQNYERAIELDPQNPQQPINMARVNVIVADLLQGVEGQNNARNESLSQALNYIQKSVDLKGDYAPAHFLMAQVFVRQGEIQKAITKGAELTAASPSDAGLAFQLGILYYQSGTFNEAQKEFERAVTIAVSNGGDYANARYFLGLIYDRQGRTSQAIAQFENIEKFNPDNAEVKTILSNLRAGRDALQGISPPGPPPETRTDVPVSETVKDQ
jgi:tetratricopeptide (TPR) repeat protein